VPSEAELDYKYRIPHRPNLTGTQRAYRPNGYLFQKNAKVSTTNSCHFAIADF
jgi:NADH:ubiquinone oxidoreductase subunit